MALPPTVRLQNGAYKAFAPVSVFKTQSGRSKLHLPPSKEKAQSLRKVHTGWSYHTPSRPNLLYTWSKICLSLLSLFMPHLQQVSPVQLCFIISINCVLKMPLRKRSDRKAEIAAAARASHTVASFRFAQFPHPNFCLTAPGKKRRVSKVRQQLRLTLACRYELTSFLPLFSLP